MTALEACRENVISRYRERTPGSRSSFDRAKRVLPGGASGNLRYFAPHPLYMKSGKGCITTDVDNNDYIDCFSCNGPLMLGHRHPVITAAVEELTRVGSLVLNPEIMIECAERLQRIIPCAERVRFLNSGTEAVMTAVRLARGFTGKPKIIKFFGHYHGQDDQFLLGVAPTRAMFGTGIPVEAVQNTLTLPFGDLAALEALLRSRNDIAAVMVDPAMHAGGLWGAETHFLSAVRAATAKYGVVLIFDEVITGFRLGLAGAQGYHGVRPDLATFGKALSAGEKLGAVVGIEKVMRVTDPLAPATVPRVFQSGTGNDGTMALAAANAAMAEYERLDGLGEYEALAARTESLELALRSIFREHSIDLHINRLGSMMQLFVSRKKPSFEAYADLNNDLLELFYLAMINEGVMLSLPTSNHIYFSFMHNDSAIGAVAQAARKVLLQYPFAEAFNEIS